MRATLRAALAGLRRGRPAPARPGSDAAPPIDPFDAEHGVQTAGFIDWRDLQAGAASDAYNSGYLGVAPSILRLLLDRVDNSADATFVDLGCGKGRALIVASERPFRRILGVELAEPLAACARRNAAIVGESHPQRTPIEVIHGDASRFDPPAGPLVVFLYQPFERPVLRAVLDRLARAQRAERRPMLLIYLSPVLASVIDRDQAWRRCGEGVGTPTAAERPFTYGGAGTAERFVIWRHEAGVVP